MIYIFDIHTEQVLYANQHFAEVLEYNNHSQYHRSYDALIHPDDLPRIKIYREACKTLDVTETATTELRLRHADGSWQWFSKRTKAFKRDENGLPIQVLNVAQDITDQKRAEEERHQNEALYRTLAQNLPDTSVFLFDKDMRFKLVEGALLERQGLVKEEMEGKLFYEIAQPDAIDRLEKYYLETLEGKSQVYEFQGPDQRYYISQFMPIHNMNDDIAFGMVVARDVTQTKLNETKIRQSEERYRSVVENQTELVTRFRADYTYVYVNHAYAKYFDVDAEEIVGQSFLQFIPQEEQEATKTKIAQIIETKQGQTYENPSQLANGDIRWFQWHDQPIMDVEGNVVEIMGVGRDITERKKAEKALRQSEKRYRTVVENQAEFVSRYKPDLTLTFVNQAYAKYFNVKPKKVKGKSILELIPQDEWKAVQERFEEIIKTKSSMTHEHQVIRADGELRWNEWHNQPILDEFGEVVEILGIGRDVTERVMAEEALKMAYDEMELRVKERTAELQEANDELNAFAYSVSHDLRAPLRALSNYSQFLQEDCADDLDDLGKEYVQGIAESAYEMEQLVVDLLDLSRIGREEIEIADVDLGHLLRQVTTRLNLNGNAEVKIPEHLPTILSKKVRLQQIFGNLISNGLKFTRPDVKPCVEIEAVEQAETWDIIVRDNGIGIDEKYLEQIFGMFQRLHTSEEYPGTGIGLAIVKKAMDEIKGEITVESELGKGTQFVLTFSKV